MHRRRRPASLLTAVPTAVLLAAALAACSGGSGGEQAAEEPSPPPPSSPSASSSSSSEATGPVPVALPEGDRYVWRFSVAPDGRTALLGRSAGFFPQTRQSTVVQVTRQDDGSWGEQQPVPWSDGSTADLDPVFTGDAVLFSSIRGGRADVQVWSVPRAADGTFGEPAPLPGVDGSGDELYPTVGPDGALYVGSDSGGTGFDVVRYAPDGAGGWSSPAPLPAPVTLTSWEFNPVFTPDGAWLVFTALDREGGAGLGDLFASRFDGTSFAEPVPLTSVNSAADEYHPSFSPDGTTMYLVRGGELLEMPVAGTELG